MLKRIYTCDCCGAEHKEANHWFVLERTRVGFHLQTWAWAVREQRLDDDDMKHVCGQACAHRMLDWFLTESGGEQQIRHGCFTTNPKGEDNV